MNHFDRQLPFILPHVYEVTASRRVRLDTAMSGAVYVALQNLAERQDDCRYIMWGSFENSGMTKTTFRFFDRVFPALRVKGYMGARIIWYGATDTPVWMMCFDTLEPATFRHVVQHQLGIFGMQIGDILLRQIDAKGEPTNRWEKPYFTEFKGRFSQLLVV